MPKLEKNRLILPASQLAVIRLVTYVHPIGQSPSKYAWLVVGSRSPLLLHPRTGGSSPEGQLAIGGHRLW